jgi:hypothetical protein
LTPHRSSGSLTGRADRPGGSAGRIGGSRVDDRLHRVRIQAFTEPRAIRRRTVGDDDARDADAMNAGGQAVRSRHPTAARPQMVTGEDKEEPRT